MAAGHSRKCLPKEMQKMADEGDGVASTLAYRMVSSYILGVLHPEGASAGSRGRQMSMGECTED